MNTVKRVSSLALLTAVVSLSAGCGQGAKNGGPASPGGNGAKPSPSASVAPKVDMTTPLTLKIEYGAGDDIYKQEIGDRLKAKFPAITFQPVHITKSLSQSLTEMAASGDYPDLFWLGAPNDIGDLRKVGLQLDLNSMIKRDNYDLQRFEPAALTAVANQSDNGEMLGLPWQTSSGVLFYNKDLFNKFSVAYPKDGMTWQDTLELGKKLTRTDGGVQYRGFDIGQFGFLWQEYGLATYDTKTFKSTFTTEPKWKSILQYFHDVYAYPGNMPAVVKQDRNGFVKDKVVAMLPWTAYFQPFLDAQKSGLNFDIVSLPTWPDAKGQGISPEGAVLAISAKSKYKDQAFEVLKYLESDEVETANSRIGFLPAITLQAARDQFGKELAGADQLNMKAVFYNKPTAPPKVEGIYQDISQGELMSILPKVAAGSLDVNTALAQAADSSNKKIANKRAN